MREIKFRAWNGERIIERIENDGEYVVCFNGEIRCIKHGDTPFNVTLPQGLILMQFTGLKDKNGKEIYEGDIVEFYRQETGDSKIERIIEEVRYIGQKFYPYDLYECEILGNVFENPEPSNMLLAGSVPIIPPSK